MQLNFLNLLAAAAFAVSVNMPVAAGRALEADHMDVFAARGVSHHNMLSKKSNIQRRLARRASCRATVVPTSSSTSATPTSTQAPETTSTPPADTYTPPADTYTPPAETYSAPAQTTTASSGGQGTGYSGTATYFFQNGVAGACGNVNSDDAFIVAIPYALWGDQNSRSDNCGKTVTMCNDKTGSCIDATVADLCPTCVGDYSIDLSQGLYNALAAGADGVFQTTYYLH
ncbi:hypothetical protein CYLTODRAFT_418137 [Cylindrobasidium torrendii FP15055 ss-10]|uniref:Expansin-like EG45 domain-containing protein n=1 Tax=Cylindrobasidium torrendii FP15055 ss-10 TaxID=1314674 RepID=A0A0D7BPM0_9AGAR|nr:hypothetical protein CYLTODRAFT_418137 [Cylindrobasidium torrendii FP15055 ss-10]